MSVGHSCVLFTWCWWELAHPADLGWLCLESAVVPSNLQFHWQFGETVHGQLTAELLGQGQ